MPGQLAHVGVSVISSFLYSALQGLIHLGSIQLVLVHLSPRTRGIQENQVDTGEPGGYKGTREIQENQGDTGEPGVYRGTRGIQGNQRDTGEPGRYRKTRGIQRNQGDKGQPGG